MLDYLICFLIALMGSDHFQTREFAQRLLDIVVVRTDRIEPVESACEHKDLEIRYRCRRIVVRYYGDPSYDVPEGLCLSWFDKKIAPALWEKANQNLVYEDAQVFVYLLATEKRMKPKAIREVIEKAQANQFLHAWFGHARFWLDKHNLPPLLTRKK